MRHWTLVLSLFFCISFTAFSQSTISGELYGEEETLSFANCLLLSQIDSTLIKVESTDDNGRFSFRGIADGAYFITFKYVGLQDYSTETISLDSDLDLGKIKMLSGQIELQEAIVSAQRAMVEVKPDRTVFNVQGTINSVGNNGLDLLRKAPGVLVDNNDDISVLGRSGVLVYVDGRRLPLSGDELTSYLQNLSAEQIDQIDIITNPGAKYEAEGNAGIIDIRLRKSEEKGANGTISTDLTQGIYFRNNNNLSANYKNEFVNVFSGLFYGTGKRVNRMSFDNYQNDILLKERNRTLNDFENYNARLGADFKLNPVHSIGFQVEFGAGNADKLNQNQGDIFGDQEEMNLDSVLIAQSITDVERDRQSYNLNYRYKKGETSVDVNLDYGNFDLIQNIDQPNTYYEADGKTPLSEANTRYVQGSDISISTFKLDLEQGLLGGTLGLGTKLSQVVTSNEFLFYNVEGNSETLNTKRTNLFDYDEKVYAAYAEYKNKLSSSLSYSLGLRTEITDALGVLTPRETSLQEDPVKQNYVSLFPSAGLVYQLSPISSLSLNYGRRINRPDYNVLNPFEEQLSELSFSKGNAFLKPEIVNNLELGYTYQYRYTFKLAYSKTIDKITRLIAPDERDPRAGFINWDNLAEQTIYNFNISAPFTVTEWWSCYLNANALYLYNEATYENGSTIDLGTFSYSFFQQQTFQLGKGYSAELSGYYSGPGIWGGVFEYDSNWSLNIGLQKKFFQNRLNVKLSANDIFYQSGWSGESNFSGLRSNGMGNWDSRFVNLNLSYSFGNNKLKFKKRKTGLDEESKRLGSN